MPHMHHSLAWLKKIYKRNVGTSQLFRGLEFFLKQFSYACLQGGFVGEWIENVKIIRIYLKMVCPISFPFRMKCAKILCFSHFFFLSSERRCSVTIFKLCPHTDHNFFEILDAVLSPFDIFLWDRAPFNLYPTFFVLHHWSNKTLTYLNY